MDKALTPKQEKFCRAYIETGNASEAYRRAYDAGGMKSETINRRAKECLDNGKIAACLASLKGHHLKRHDITVDSLVVELEEARTLAGTNQVPSAMVSASMGKAKLLGLLVDKQEHTGRGGEPLQPPEASTRDIARAILTILRQAKVEGRPEDSLSGDAAVEAARQADATTSPPDNVRFSSMRPPSSSAAAPSLTPGDKETFENGGWIVFDPERRKYICFDAAGDMHGMRRDYDSAVVFARSLP